VITRAPAGRPLAELGPEGVTGDLLDDLFAQMMKLRSAGISHGAVIPQTIVADPGREAASLVDFRNGTSAASVFVLDQDLAGGHGIGCLVGWAGAYRRVRDPGRARRTAQRRPGSPAAGRSPGMRTRVRQRPPATARHGRQVS